MTITYTLAGESQDSIHYDRVSDSALPPFARRDHESQWRTFVQSITELNVEPVRLVHDQHYYPVYLDYNANGMIELETSRSSVAFTGLSAGAIEFTFPGDYTIYLTRPEFQYEGSCYLVVDSLETRDSIVTLAAMIFTRPEWQLVVRAFREDGALRRVIKMSEE